MKIVKVDLIIGFGYDNATLAEHRHPTREDLDKISKDTPILLWHQSGHIVAVNSKAQFIHAGLLAFPSYGPESLSRVLGLGGSSSRIVRITAS